LGGGTFVQFSGIPEGKHNVLRDLQQSPLGKKANQLESMTIELVAMLFDFIFETEGPARRHQGAARAPADSRCSRPRCSTARSSRRRIIRRGLLVNALAEADGAGRR
jgi:hypothetical protein